MVAARLLRGHSTERCRLIGAYASTTTSGLLHGQLEPVPRRNPDRLLQDRLGTFLYDGATGSLRSCRCGAGGPCNAGALLHIEGVTRVRPDGADVPQRRRPWGGMARSDAPDAAPARRSRSSKR